MNILTLVFYLSLFLVLELSLAEQYYRSYYSYQIDAFVECFGNSDVEPFCIKTFDQSEQKQMYRESDFKRIDQPVPRKLNLHNDDNISVQRTRGLRGATQKAQPLFHDATKKNPKILKNFVLLVRFPEHRDRYLFSTTEFDIIFNGDEYNNVAKPPGHSTHDITIGRERDHNITLDNLKQLIPTGSIRTFYKKQLYGKLDLQSTVVGWVDVNITEKEAAGGCSALCPNSRFREAIAEALRVVEAQGLINFAEFDSDNDGFVDVFTVISSSAGAESATQYDDLGVERSGRIWSHKYVLPAEFVSKNDSKRIRRYSVSPGFFGANANMKMPTRIGVIAHEVAHFLGLGDFYDTTYKSAGLHIYDTMANSWGVSGQQLRPNNFSPRNKERLGFLNGKRPKIGRNLIRPSNGDSDGEVFVLSGEAYGYDPAETIYIDFWKNDGYSANHPGGILIYHADERIRTGNTQPYYPAIATKPHNHRHYQVRLIQANGEFKLERQAWPSRYDPTVFWNSNTLELSDYGPNNLMSWAQLEKHDTKACLTTGNYFYGFKKLTDDLYEFYYQSRPRENCYEQTKPTRTY